MQIFSAIVGLALALSVSASPAMDKRADTPPPLNSPALLASIGSIIGQIDLSKVDGAKLKADLGTVIADIAPALANVDLEKLPFPLPPAVLAAVQAAIQNAKKPA